MRFYVALNEATEELPYEVNVGSIEDDDVTRVDVHLHWRQGPYMNGDYAEEFAILLLDKLAKFHDVTIQDILASHQREAIFACNRMNPPD